MPMKPALAVASVEYDDSRLMRPPVITDCCYCPDYRGQNGRSIIAVGIVEAKLVRTIVAPPLNY